jgi:hypothetical protein
MKLFTVINRNLAGSVLSQISTLELMVLFVGISHTASSPFVTSRALLAQSATNEIAQQSTHDSLSTTNSLAVI